MHKIARIEGVESWDEPGLTGCRLKLARAQELFDSLQWESAQFRLNGKMVKPGEIRSETDDLGNKWSVLFCGEITDIPMRLSLLAGDTVHNLRTVLDHAVYQLVLRDQGKPTTRNAWPMYREEPVGQALGRYNAQLKGIKDKDVRIMIDWFQPYQQPTNPVHKNLALLSTLDNIDKHRLIRPGVAVLTDAHAAPGAIFSHGEVKAGNELYRFPENTHSPDAALQFQLAFWEQRVTMAHLGELVETVALTLDKISVFFSPHMLKRAQRKCG